MGKMKHVVAIIIVLTSLIGGFIFLLPKLSGMLATDSTTNATATDSTTVQESVPDTLSFEEKMQQVQKNYPTSISIGTSTAESHPINYVQCIHQADDAMYKKKQARKAGLLNNPPQSPSVEEGHGIQP